MKPDLTTHDEYVSKMKTTLKNVSESGAGQTQSRNKRATGLSDYDGFNRFG